MTIEEVHNLLSIQSHVVHGYVGNKSATFPLQCQGWDVDVLNTVNFSNHTGYGSVKGTKASPEDLKLLYDGLKDIGINYDAFLTGYVPGAESLEVVGEIGLDLKASNPDCLWLLDPVMGDEGHLYVSDTVIPVYRKLLLRGQIDIITPNQFEAELLVDFSITDDDSLRKALEILHDKYKVRNVVITSLKFNSTSNKILSVASTNYDNDIITSVFEIPYIESYFTGVGDLFSALLIDRVHRYSKSIKNSTFLEEAVNEVLTVMSTVLTRTSQAAQRSLGTTIKSKMGSASTMRESELRLIECRDVYSSTYKHYKSTRL